MKDTYYFSHDSNARNDIKILNMRHKYGLAGYGAYWIIIEMLRESDNYKMESIVNSFVLQMYMPKRWVTNFINDCVNKYHLLEIQDGYLYSESLNKRMEHLDEIRLKRKKAIAKRWAKNKTDTNVIQNDTKESKVKEIKVNNINKDINNPILNCNKEDKSSSNWKKNYKEGMDSERNWKSQKEKRDDVIPDEAKIIIDKALSKGILK